MATSVEKCKTKWVELWCAFSKKKGKVVEPSGKLYKKVVAQIGDLFKQPHTMKDGTKATVGDSVAKVGAIQGMASYLEELSKRGIPVECDIPSDNVKAWIKAVRELFDIKKRGAKTHTSSGARLDNSEAVVVIEPFTEKEYSKDVSATTLLKAIVEAIVKKGDTKAMTPERRAKLDKMRAEAEADGDDEILAFVEKMERQSFNPPSLVNYAELMKRMSDVAFVCFSAVLMHLLLKKKAPADLLTKLKAKAKADEEAKAKAKADGTASDEEGAEDGEADDVADDDTSDVAED